MEDNFVDDEDILNDLDELENDDLNIHQDEDQDQEVKDSEENEMDEQRQEEIKQARQEFMQEFKHDAKEVSYLLKEKEFISVIEKLKSLVLQKPKKYIDVNNEEYNLIKRANEYGSIIDKEIQSVHKYVKDEYQKKFPELEKIVLNPIEYAKCVKKIKNQQEYSQIDFSGLLTSHQILAITVAGSSSTGQQLTNTEMERVFQACDVVFKLDEYQKLALTYIETRMLYIAPNVSKLVGTQCASRLMGASGGIDVLSTMPACNIQVMGSQKKALLGLSRAGQGFNRGYFGSLDFVQKAPTKFQTKLVRMLSTNVAKCARIDFLRTCPDGSAGQRIKDLMLQRFDKIQEPQQGKQAKPMAPPDDKPKPKRGGKRFRKMKERLAQTEIRRYQNRLTFGDKAEEEFRDSGIGLGQLTNKKGQSSGKIKHQNKNEKLKMSKKMQQRLVQINNSNSNQDSGIVSSIAFTPVQGMELVNPSNNQQGQNIPDNYFKKDSGFRTVVAEKKKSLLSMLGPMNK